MNTSPYPGLRPFSEQEADIFFGREEQIEQLLSRLDNSRFLSIIGVSGCGKSSLVKAGLIPAVTAGFLPERGVNWRTATMRPGNRPMWNLASALLRDSVLDSGTSFQFRAEEAAFLLATLRRGKLGLLEVLQEHPLPENTNLLLLIDQFEDIFRYSQRYDADEANAFIALVLETIKQTEVPVFVAITMRSDFLGECPIFQGLPEMMNDNQFLTPRLTRAQYRAAIVGPAAMFGGQVEPQLVNHLLNEVGINPDQLPVLQHCLMRMWQHAGSQQANTSEGTGYTLTLDHYAAVGGLANALSNHADEAFNELDSRQQKIAEYLFRRLSERGGSQRDTRNPVPIGDVASVAQVSVKEVVDVVNVFRRRDRSFLTPAFPAELDAKTILDISHESLIRQWRRLSQWATQEAESSEIYQRLETTATLWREKKAEPWGKRDLDNALAWRKREQPTPEWAARYGQNFSVAMEFLDTSAREQEKKRREEEENRQKRYELELLKQRWKVVAAVVVILVVLLTGALLSLRQAVKATAEAARQAEIAEEEKLRAEQQTRIAQAGQLAAQAQLTLDAYPQRSLLLAVEALNISLRNGTEPLPSAEQALRNVLSNTGGLGLSGDDGMTVKVSITHDGHWVITQSQGGLVRVWDLHAPSPVERTFALIDPAPSPESETVFSLSDDHRWLMINRDSNVTLWNLDGAEPQQLPQPLQTEESESDPVEAFAVGHKNRCLITQTISGRVQIWNFQETREMPVVPIALSTPEESIFVFALSNDRRWLFTLSEKGFLQTWDLQATDVVASGTLLSPVDEPVRDFSVSPDGRWLLMLCENGVLHARELRASEPYAAGVIPLSTSDDPIRSFTISENAEWVVTQSDNLMIQVWNLPALRAQSSPIFMSQSAFSNLYLSPDNQWLALWNSPDQSNSPEQSQYYQLFLWNMNTIDVETRPTHRYQYSTPMREIHITQNGRWLVTMGSESQELQLWDLDNTDFPPSSTLLRGHEGKIGQILLSEDSRWLITAGDDQMVRIWDLQAENPALKPRILHGHEGMVSHISIDPESRWLITYSYDDNTARLWNIDAAGSGADPLILRGHQTSIESMALSLDSSTLLTGSSDGAVWLWNLQEERFRQHARSLSWHEGAIRSVTISPDKRWVAIGGSNFNEILWELNAQGEVIDSIRLAGYTAPVNHVAFTPDGKWLVTVSDDSTIQMWDLFSTRSELYYKHWQGHDEAITSVAMSPDGHWLITGSDDTTAKVWDLQAKNPEETAILLAGHTDTISAIAVSPDNHWVATGSWDNTVRMWNVQSDSPGADPRILHGHEDPVQSVAISPDNRWVATGSWDNTVRLWDLDSPDSSATSSILEEHDDIIDTVLFSPDGHVLASVGSWDRTVQLWKFQSSNPGADVIVLPGHDEPVTSMAFSHDNEWFITGSDDGTMRVWRLPLHTLVTLACQTAGRNLSRDEWAQYFPDSPYRKICSDFSDHWSLGEDSLEIH